MSRQWEFVSSERRAANLHTRLLTLLQALVRTRAFGDPNMITVVNVGDINVVLLVLDLVTEPVWITLVMLYIQLPKKG